MILIIEKIFTIVFPILMIISVISNLKQEHQEEKERKEEKKKSEEPTWCFVVELFIVLCAIFIFFGGILFLGLKAKFWWLLIIFTSTALIDQIRTAHFSLKILKKIVMTNEKTPIDKLDSLAIGGVSYIIWYVAACNYTSKLFALVEKIPNDIVSDLSIMILNIILCFIYLFFILAILQNILYNIAAFIKKIIGACPWKDKIGSIEKKLESQEDDSIRGKKITFKYIKWLKRLRLIWRSILCLTVPIPFVIDVSIVMFIVMYGILTKLLKYVAIFVLYLKNTFIKGLDIIIELSNRHITAILFRISIVVALILIVVHNRYDSIFKLSDSSTAILEFVASSIIIPIVFEWIHSLKKDNSPIMKG